MKFHCGMRKLLILIFLNAAPFLVNAQLVGDGSFGNPWHGTLIGNTTWSGTKYINGDIIVDNEKLTISAGAKIIFLAEGADLFITITGQLEAIGTPGSPILFTADDNNNGIYGEPGERWGHISFQNMTTTNPQLYPSIIENCIIEYGQKNSSPSAIESYGGGLQISFTYLTVSYSIFRNNFAGWGGGIFVNQNVSPTFSNCSIYNNIAANAGGGIYVWANSNSHITNSLVYNNSSGPTGGGGVFLGDNCGNVRIINCTISNNSSSDAVKGQNIQFHYTPQNRISVINSIIWGSNNSIYYLGFNPTVNDFINCALQDVLTPAATFTNCINLSGNNSDATGPNFIAIDGTNWSIKFISPCRDAGTSTGAPATDILGNSRIGNYDIGAYEVQYNTWKTTAISTDWATAGNWNLGVPNSSQDVIIPTGATYYPTGSSSQNFTIDPGKFFIIEPAAAVTLGILTNNGTIRLNSNASGIASLIMGRYFDFGTEEIQLYLTGGGSPPNWHYISSPVSLLSTTVFTPTTVDLAQYLENRISDNKDNGWVAVDGWIYLPAPGTFGGPTFDHLNIGQGYNHYARNDHTYTFDGTFNSGNVNNIPIAYNSGGGTENPTAQGFNLLGNPFSSCLDWGQIESTLDPSIGRAIYFNKNGSFASWANGVGTNGGTGTIPPMQGFFIKTYAVGNSVTIPASARVHNVFQTRYKKGLEIIPLVRLKLVDQLNSDDVVVRFDEKATTAVDNAFDAYKFSETGTSIWTSSGGVDFSINGLPFPESIVEIPVTINSASAGNLTISGTQIDGLENYSVTLTDNVNNITINLKTTPDLAFNSPGGKVANRFILKVSTITTAIPETTVSNKPFNIYSSKGIINIQTLDDNWNGKSGGVKVMNMTGRIIASETNIVFSRDEIRQIPAATSNGIYLVEIRSGVMRYVGKVVIR